MEIKLNNNDTVLLVAAAAGLLAFFLPWINLGIFGQPSGYDLFAYGHKMGENNSWFLLLLPASFLFISLFRLGIVKNIDSTLMKIIELVPLALILYSIFKLAKLLKLNVENLHKIDLDFLQVFEIGIIFTLLSSIIVAFMPVKKVVPRIHYYHAEMELEEIRNDRKVLAEIDESITTGRVKIESGSFSMLQWTKKKTVVLIVTGALGIFTTAGYLIFIKNYPEKDGKELAMEFCDCYENYDKDLSKAYTVFLSSFESAGFTTRNEARTAFSNSANSANTTRYSCTEEVNHKYINTVQKYSDDVINQSQFQYSYSQNQSTCTSSEKKQVQNLFTDITAKIEAIKDPEPDEMKIQEDLIGNKIPGWKFSFLSEFREFKKLSTTHGKDIIEYKVQMKLVDESRNTEHDCEVLIVYKRAYEGWKFNKVKMNYITYINTILPDQWTTIVPLRGCRWNCEDTYKIAWKLYNYGHEVISGPDAPHMSLPNSSSYLVKSREGIPVEVKFTYRPI